MSLVKYSEYKNIVDRLGEAIRNGRVSHAYIIEGDRMSGKEGFAKEFAKAILCTDKPGVGCDNCKHCRMIDANTYRDIYYVASDERSVKDKDIEEIQERLANLPMEDGDRNIAFIYDCDSMTTRAQNRLLKSLEEPHPGTVIMLLSENSDNLLPTVKSRCQTIRLYSTGNREAEPEEQQYIDLAKTMVGMVKNKAYFFEIKDALESVKDKKSALLFLDAFEREIRNYMVEGTSESITPKRAVNIIEHIEKSRRDIRYNIKERNTLRDLMLKIGG